MQDSTPALFIYFISVLFGNSCFTGTKSVGLDIGPFTNAVVSDNDAHLMFLALRSISPLIEYVH